MRTVSLSDPIFSDEHAARQYFEALRWPNGPVCPHCGSVNDAAPMRGKSTRPGVWKCRRCRRPFTCTVGTALERSKIPLSKWLLAIYLTEIRARAVSARQLHLRLDVSYKTALYMMRRIHESRGWSNDRDQWVKDLPAQRRSSSRTPPRPLGR